MQKKKKKSGQSTFSLHSDQPKYMRYSFRIENKDVKYIVLLKIVKTMVRTFFSSCVCFENSTGTLRVEELLMKQLLSAEWSVRSRIDCVCVGCKAYERLPARAERLL